MFKNFLQILSLFPFISMLYSGDLKDTESNLLDERIESYLSSMTLEDKVGQIFMIEISHISPEEVSEYKIGAILNGGGSFPYGKKNHSVKDWQLLADKYFISSKNGVDGKGIPVLWGTDAVHGHNNLRGAVLYPHNIGLGATRNIDLIRDISSAVAQDVYLSGLDLTFAPAVSVPVDDRWGRTYEGFSEDPELVAKMGKAAVEGYQGELNKDFLKKGKVLATAKHFIGDGGTLNGVDKGNTVLTQKDLIDIHGQGYFSTIESGVQFIMASFNSWNGEKLHGHEYLLTNLLKKDMGFKGVVLGDWNGHQEVDGCLVSSCPEAINAGLDMFMVTDSWKSLYKNTLAQAKSGKISISRLNDAVRRVLRVKLLYGLFNKERPAYRYKSFPNETIDSKSHRDLARQAVRESLVLLKNNNKTLPLNPSKKILVIGKGAKDISKISGGWSFTWQGTGTTNKNFPGATTIYQGLERFVKKAKGEIYYSVDGKSQSKPDSAIIVIGEDPYAEYQGSVNDLSFNNNEFDHLTIAKELKEKGVEIIYLFISGRPLWVNKELNTADAFVATWLPGTEGDGIAEVLFAQTQNGLKTDFMGKLPFSWPKDVNQSTLNFWESSYEPLFKYGYGLTLKDNIFIDLLEEDAKFVKDSRLGDVLLQGWPTKGYQVIVGSPSGESIFNKKIMISKNNEVSVRIIDGKLQEDAYRVSFNKGPSNWSLQNTTGLNLQTEEQASGILTFDFRLLKEDLDNPLFYRLDCGTNCDLEIDIRPFILSLEEKKWQTIGLPLKCLKSKGADLRSIDSLIGFSSMGKWKFDIGKIYLEGGEGGKSIFPCN